MSSLQEHGLAVEDVVYTSILLLGFSPEKMENKYGLPFDKAAIRNGNKKSLEVILHFLFVKLDATAAKDRFRFCWPIMDKKQESQFRKEAGEWLKSIASSHPQSNISKLAPSILVSPSGQKFQSLLLHFSSHVLRVKLSHEVGKEALQDLGLHPPNFQSRSANASKLTQAAEIGMCLHSKRLCERFLRSVRRGVHLQRKWRHAAEQLTQQLQRLQSRIDEVQTSLRSEPHVQLNEREVSELRERLHAIDSFFVDTKADLVMLQEVTQGKANQAVLDASSLDVGVPDSVAQRLSDENSDMVSNVPLYHRGMLRLSQLVKAATSALSIIAETIDEDSPWDYVNMETALKRTDASLQSSLFKLSQKSRRSQELASALKSMAERVATQLDSMLPEHTPHGPHMQARLGQYPATPEVRGPQTPGHMASGLSTSQQNTPTVGSILGPDYNAMSTPTVLSRIMKRAEQQAHAANSSPRSRPVDRDHLSATSSPARGPPSSADSLATQRSRVRKPSRLSKAAQPDLGPISASREQRPADPVTRRSASQSGRRQSSADTGERAQDLLAEEIVSHVAVQPDMSAELENWASPSIPSASASLPQSLQDPLAAIEGRDAFKSRDVLMRTPLAARGGMASARTGIRAQGIASASPASASFDDGDDWNQASTEGKSAPAAARSPSARPQTRHREFLSPESHSPSFHRTSSGQRKSLSASVSFTASPLTERAPVTQKSGLEGNVSPFAGENAAHAYREESPQSDPDTPTITFKQVDNVGKHSFAAQADAYDSPAVRLARLSPDIADVSLGALSSTSFLEAETPSRFRELDLFRDDSNSDSDHVSSSLPPSRSEPFASPSVAFAGLRGHPLSGSPGSQRPSDQTSPRGDNGASRSSLADIKARLSRIKAQSSL